MQSGRSANASTEELMMEARHSQPFTRLRASMRQLTDQRERERAEL